MKERNVTRVKAQEGQEPLQPFHSRTSSCVRLLKTHLCPRPQGNDDENRFGAQNISLLAIRPPDADLAQVQ